MLPAPKSAGIREHLHLSPGLQIALLSVVRYYQLLNALLDEPDALAYDPLVVHRLRQMRLQRRRARFVGRTGLGHGR